MPATNPLDTLDRLISAHIDRRSIRDLKAIAEKARTLAPVDRRRALALALRAEAAIRFVRQEARS